jgi:hypothetical protein
MLSNPSFHTYPFPFFQCSRAFGPAILADFDALFSSSASWQQRDGAFYKCFLREVTDEIPAAWLTELVARMRAITGLPLMEKVQVTAQRVEPGQVIGVHSDQPLVGYELVRLVLQLNDSWCPEDGGLLELYESTDRPPAIGIEPRRDVAFGFVLHEGSLHGVTEVTRPRRSMVFNFWHAANSPELGEAVERTFGDMHVGLLPSDLDAVMEEAEATLPEEVSFRASLAAWALLHWGYESEIVVAGYRHSAGLPSTGVLRGEERSAILLADWVARLHEEPFDLVRWEVLKDEIGEAKPFPCLSPMGRLCFP